LGILVQLYFKLYIRTGTYSQVSWCRSTLENTYPQEPSLKITVRCPSAALFQAEHTHRNLLLGIWVQLYVELCIQTGTCSPVSWGSSSPSYTYTYEHTLGYPGAALFQEINSHRNLLMGILDQLFFKLYLHTGTYSWVSWCSSSSSYTSCYTYTQKQTLWYPGAALFHVIPLHRNLLLGILVQLSFKLYLHKETYSRVSWCSSLSSYIYI